jgi:hypothetical protein
MSVVLLSTQTNNTGAGSTLLLDAGNYVFGDITVVMSQFSASSGTEIVFTAALQSLDLNTGVTTSIQQLRFVEAVTPSQTIFANQVIQRSFPSLLMLPMNSQIIFTVSVFANLVEVNITIDISGFMY